MQGVAHSHLNLFQIQAAGLVLLGEDHLQKSLYLAADFLMDGLGRFFSWDRGSPATAGRRRQIFSFNSIKSRVSFWNWRNALTSRSALRCASGVENVSVTVLPLTL
jgi:hypothetical protein